MSTSGADAPAGISVGGIKANSVLTQSPTTQTSPSKQQVPQPQPSAENSSSIREAPLANVTHPYQQAINPQANNQSLNLQTIIVYLIGCACAISFTATAYVTLRLKRKQTSETS